MLCILYVVSASSYILRIYLVLLYKDFRELYHQKYHQISTKSTIPTKYLQFVYLILLFGSYSSAKPL